MNTFRDVAEALTATETQAIDLHRRIRPLAERLGHADEIPMLDDEGHPEPSLGNVPTEIVRSVRRVQGTLSNIGAAITEIQNGLGMDEEALSKEIEVRRMAEREPAPEAGLQAIRRHNVSQRSVR